MKDSKKRSKGTQTRSQKFTAEEKLIAILERELAEARKANAKLLRMVEMVMDERFYRSTVTGGVRDNEQTSVLPLESLNDVATFDDDQDKVQQQEWKEELTRIASEHDDWRKARHAAETIVRDLDEVRDATAA